MKASTLFVICIALFIGLSAMAGAKYAGLFERTPNATPSKVEPMMILVANNDLYPDIAIGPSDVRIRELTPLEQSGDFFEKNKGKLLPANVSAANLRIPNRKIRADEPLMRDMFLDDLPAAVSLRLAKGMEAVNVAVTRGRSAGGVLQLGEYVNVYLTSRVKDGDGRESIRTAQLARDCRVIMKRDSMWIVKGYDGEGPIPFTLEANPYRAALIDYAQHKGDLSLRPVFNVHTSVRNAMPNQQDGGKSDNMGMAPYGDMNSHEYREEDVRVSKILAGDYQIGDADMARIFGIKPAPARNLVAVRDVIGIYPRSNQVLDVGANLPGYGYGAPPSNTAPPLDNGSGSVSSLEDPKTCKTCGPGKKDTDNSPVGPLNEKQK